ncbi:MAG TPA: PQQ-binding-like beta-propeller repeat protein [Myxococcales bacterium]
MSRLLAIAVALATAPAFAAQDWPQSRRDAQNTGSIELDAPKSARPRPWSFEGSGRVWGYEPGMVVWTGAALGVVEGRAIVAVGSYDRIVYVLDAATGEQVWKLTTGGPLHGAPVIWKAGGTPVLFAASSDRLVYAADAATGKSLWVHSVEDYRPTLGGARLSAPCVGQAVGQDAVFVSHWVFDRSLGHSLQRGGVTALSAKDGKPIWTKVLTDNEVTAAITSGNRLWVGSSDGNLYALDADTGRVLWQKTELDAVRGPPAFVPGERPMVVTASKFGMVRGLDAESGDERWSFKTGDRVTASPVLIPGDRVIVGSYDRRLWSLDVRTGQVAWSYAARGGIYASAAYVPSSPALLLAPAWDHALHAVSAQNGAHQFTTYTGQPLWTVGGLDDSNWAAPSAARIQGSWIVFHGSYDGTLRALPLDERDRRPPPVRSNGWFWLSFPISLVPVALFAMLLTRWDRMRRRA